MADTVVKSFRADPALWARVESAAQAAGMKAPQWVLGVISEALGTGSVPAVVAKRAPAPRVRPEPSRLDKAHAALEVAEERAKAQAAPRERLEPPPFGSRLKRTRRGRDA